MLVEITETHYKGFLLQLVKDQGWKIVLGDEEYLFPHRQAAEACIDDFIANVIKIHNGKKLPVKKV
jgi:hypothetical protein